jgi:hypothetical protein
MTARRYRIRAYDSRGAEIFADRQYALVLDLDGYGATAAGAELDALAATLARADGARGDAVAGYHLAIHDPTTDRLVCHWAARIEE